MENIYLLLKDYMYEYKDGEVVKKDLKKEKGIYTSILPFKDIFTYTFKLPASLSEDELLIKADETVFNEASLNIEKEYKINYYFTKIKDYYIVDAFIVEVDKLKERFEDLLEVFNYIDFISPSPFVFGEYYDISRAIPQNDIFIYFTEEDAFLVGFREKEFLFARSLDKFSNLLTQTGLKKEELIEVLENYGLDKTSYTHIELYEKINEFFNQFFRKVNNLINYSKNFYNLETINKIYFYSNFEIKNLFENYQSFWDLSGIEFKKFEILEIEGKFDPFEYCAVIFNANNCLNENLNFSVFLRPPKFYKTESGRLILFVLLLLLFILGDAGYKYMLLSSQQKEIEKLQNLVSKQEKTYKNLKKALKDYQKKLKNEKKLVADIKKEINQLALKIDVLYKIKKQKSFYNELADIIQFLVQNRLKFSQIDKNNNKYFVIIKSETDNSKLIAKFFRYLIQLGYKDVSSKQIILDKNLYITKVKFEK
jgi:hypothetical protein